MIGIAIYLICPTCHCFGATDDSKKKQEGKNQGY